MVTFVESFLAMDHSVRSYMKSFAKAVKERGGMVVFDCNTVPSAMGR